MTEAKPRPGPKSRPSSRKKAAPAAPSTMPAQVSPLPQVHAVLPDERHAPVIFFETTLASQHRDGVVGVTLGVDLAKTTAAKEIVVTRGVVAYLRMGVQAATPLRNSLDAALLMAMPAQKPSS